MNTKDIADLLPPNGSRLHEFAGWRELMLEVLRLNPLREVEIMESVLVCWGGMHVDCPADLELARAIEAFKQQVFQRYKSSMV